MVTTQFRKLSEGWNAEPNAPEPRVKLVDGVVILEFFLNSFEFPAFGEGQVGELRFVAPYRYRLGPTNDEGFHRGRCRFSSLAPAWGEFYEVTGDLREDQAPDDWSYVTTQQARALRHFLFYLRDETFECDAVDYALILPGAPRE